MRRFELKEENSTKFWELELSDKTVMVRFGQEKSTEYPWPQIAEKEIDKLVAERLRKGYQEIKAPAAGSALSAADLAKSSKDLLSAVKQFEPLKRVAKQLGSLQRPSLRIKTKAVKGKSVGFHKLGGRPDLPPGISWPIGKVAGRDIALPFIAQFDVGWLWRAYVGGPMGLLPTFGMLYFFYNMGDYGADYLSPENWRVIYHGDRDKDNLAPLEPPIPIPPHLEYKARAAEVDTEITLPNIETSYIGGPGNSDARVELTQEEWDAYADLRYEMRANQTIHQMLGHADDVQPYALENSYEGVREAFFPGDRPFKSLTPKEQNEEFYQGQLLLQVNTDENLNMTFGRGGRLFFFIREKDLRAKDFSKVWVNEQ